MKTNKQTKSPILEAVHETAADFHAGGVISKRRMREYDALCLEPIPHYKNPLITQTAQYQSGRFGDGSQHKRFNRASMGDRR
jgi:hypothetical protein